MPSLDLLYDAVRRDLEPVLQVVRRDRVAGVCVIGSAAVPDLWQPGISDIDVCVFMPEGTNLNAIAAAVRSAIPADAVRLGPHVISDVHSQRVETVFSVGSHDYDLTFLTGSVHVGRTWKEVRYDGFELYVGSIIHRGVWLEGSSPTPSPLVTRLLPYYDDNLRTERLDVLVHGLRRELEAARHFRDSARYLPRLCELQTIFVQALFIHRRQYPLSYRKHLEYQFREFLSLDPDVLLTLRSPLRDPGVIRERWISLLSS